LPIVRDAAARLPRRKWYASVRECRARTPGQGFIR
jgi:hypothetical protein